MSRLIYNYSTGLIKVTFKVTGSSVEEESVRLIGSGTFVSLSNKFGILTAGHVVDQLEGSYSLGLILSQYEHNYMIGSEYLWVFRVAKGQVEPDGPDLGFIELPSSQIGMIKAKKSFHNLEMKRDRIMVDPPAFDKGLWAICGVPAIKTINATGRKGFDSLQGFTFECGFGRIDSTYIVGDYDYCDFIINYNSSPDIPLSFGGISGGGLWQIPLIKSSENKIEPIEYILSGVAFYQTERKGLYRSIKCHGRNSIYDKAYSFIAQNRKPKTENR